MGLLGIAWADLGFTQLTSLATLQLASVVGAYGLSFLVGMTNSALAEMLTARSSCWPSRVAAVGPPALLLLFGFFAGIGAEAAPSADGVQVTVVQVGSVNRPSIFGEPTPPEEQLDRFIDVTHSADLEPGGLVIWPEAAIGGYVARDRTLQSRVARLCRRTGCYLLTGTSDCEIDVAAREVTAHYNAVVLFDPDGNVVDTYYKNRLVAMSEYVPPWLREKLGDLLTQYGAPSRSTTPGDGFKVLQAGELRVAPIICFESLFTYASREAVSQGADLLVIVTNDGWFRNTAAGIIHATVGVLRAIESRIPLARSACSGISLFCDEYGRIVEQTPQYDFEDRVLQTRVAPSAQGRRSVFTSIGDVGVWLSLPGLLAAVAADGLRLRRRSSARGPLRT
jgi:apolipoprotein N-acyltransferase